MVYSLHDQYVALTGPIVLWRHFSWAFVRVVFDALVSFDIAALLSPSTLRDRGFARGFDEIKNGFKAFEASVDVPSLVAGAYGRVLDLGPGVGNQCDHFDHGKVESVVGVEPNAPLLPVLKDAVRRAGLADKYEFVHCGMEDIDALERAGITDGSFDSIVTMQVLCTVPQPQMVAEKLYRLLKPGGKLIVWEHVACKDPGHRVLQWLWNPFWSFALRGCTVGRPIDGWLINSGEWSDIQLEWSPEKGSIMPRVGGHLIKAQK